MKVRFSTIQTLFDFFFRHDLAALISTTKLQTSQILSGTLHKRTIKIHSMMLDSIVDVDMNSLTLVMVVFFVCVIALLFAPKNHAWPHNLLV